MDNIRKLSKDIRSRVKLLENLVKSEITPMEFGRAISKISISPHLQQYFNLMEDNKISSSMAIGRYMLKSGELIGMYVKSRGVSHRTSVRYYTKMIYG